jgi:hypothetical protein
MTVLWAVVAYLSACGAFLCMWSSLPREEES